MADGSFTTWELATRPTAGSGGFGLRHSSSTDALVQAAQFGLGRGFPADALEGCGTALRAVLLGQVLVAVARNSNPSGPGARQQTIADALDVKDRLASLGVDLRDFPTEDEMNVALQKAAKVTHRMADGSTFDSRTATFDRTSDGYVLILSTGSAKKIDEQGMQPWVETLRNAVLRFNAVVVAATRFDRMLRYKWSIGRVLEPIEQRRGWVIDEMVAEEVNDQSAVIFFLRACIAEAEATKTAKNTRNGFRRHSGSEMVNGVVAVGAPQACPPGVIRLRVIGTGIAGRANSLWILDSPRYLPARNRIVEWVPKPGADQVENVRWVLSQLGRPKVTKASIADGLLERGWTTDGLRRRHGVDATWQSRHGSKRSKAYAAIDSIVKNLSFYEDGKIDVGVGAGHEPIHLSNCFPTDGPWASPQDFARIRRRPPAQQPREAVRLQFTGLRVKFNGVDGVLRATDVLDRDDRIPAVQGRGARHRTAPWRPPAHPPPAHSRPCRRRSRERRRTGRLARQPR